MKYSVPWGAEEKLEFDLPKGWEVIQIVKPKLKPAAKNVTREIERALKQPIGSKKLSEMVDRGKKIAIVVEDISRPTPTHLILPYILDEIFEGGAEPENVTIVFALGVHRPMTEAEMEKKAGKEVLDKVNAINHNCEDEDNLTYLGKTSHGTPVYVNKTVADADIKVLIGTIEPHVQAGFGGGFKNILPGVAGIETIAINHKLVATPRHFNAVGFMPEDDPMRLDLEEAGEMAGPEFFIVNAVLNEKTEIVKIFAGDPIEAHREGIKLAEEMYGVEVPKQADIVITDSYPMDIDFRQGFKCILNTMFGARDGGTLIPILRCMEGVGSVKIPEQVPSAEDMRDLAEHIPDDEILGLAETLKMPVEEQFGLYIHFKLIRRNKLIVYAPTIPKGLTASLGSPPIRSIDEAIDKAKDVYGEKADILIFPAGGVTYPILQK